MPKAAIEVDSKLQNNETVQLRLKSCVPHIRAGYTEVTLKLAISRHFHAFHGGQPPSVLRIRRDVKLSDRIANLSADALKTLQVMHPWQADGFPRFQLTGV